MTNLIHISGSFDDGSKLDMLTADLMTKYDIETIFFIPVNWQKYNVMRGVEPLSKENFTDIANNFEIGSHGTNHELLTRIDESKQNQEIVDSLKYWKQNGYKVKSFCYPRGYYTTEIKQKVKDAGYKWARTVKVGELQPSADPYETHVTVHVGLDRKEYGTDWLTYAKAKMKEAIKRAYDGETIEYRFFGHSEEINRLDQWDRFKEFLEALKDLK